MIPHWEVTIPYLPHLVVALVVAEEGLIRWEGTTGKAEAVGLRSVSLKTVFLHSMLNIFYVLSYC